MSGLKGTYSLCDIRASIVCGNKNTNLPISRIHVSSMLYESVPTCYIDDNSTSYNASNRT
jgi:hypothetical protein